MQKEKKRLVCLVGLRGKGNLHQSTKPIRQNIHCCIRIIYICEIATRETTSSGGSGVPGKTNRCASEENV